MVSRELFTGFVVCVALQRLLELRVSRRHERALRARGAREHAPEQMPWMVAVHTGWLISCLLEVWLLDRAFQWQWALPALVVFAVGQTLRLLAMHALGPRWNVRIITVPEPPVTRGVFKHLRHPNYLGVVLEIAALPMVHGAYLTALCFSAANGILLAYRIRAEERALRESADVARHLRSHLQLVVGRHR